MTNMTEPNDTPAPPLDVIPDSHDVDEETD
jgi:hypothetical protein